MFLKKQLYFQNINPKTVFTITVWLIITWILSRPLQSIGKNTYDFLGSITSNAFHSILQTKSSAEELIKSKGLVQKQSELISQMKVKINNLENEIKETNSLKKIAGFKKNINYRTIVASTIGRSADNWHKQIILNKGLQEGVMTGDTIVTISGVVGQVVDSDKNTSIVQLISDPSYKLGCKIKERNLFGIFSGKTNSLGLIEFIPIGSKVKPGDLVVTSGISTDYFSPTYLPNHPIGKIRKVSRKKSKSSDLYIEVKLSEDLNTIDDVLVFSPD